jgi:hypothetical protein
MRIIPTRIHGALDYLTVILLIALPRVTGGLEWPEKATALLSALALATLVYSLLTRYELGALRVLPVRGHLMLDFLSGITLFAAAIALKANATVTTIVLLLGLFEIGTALLSHARSPLEASTRGMA